MDTEGRVFVALEDRDQLASFASTGATPVRTFALNGCREPAGLAIDRTKNRLFVACRNRIMLIVDADSGDVLAQVAIGEGVDAMTFDDERRLAFSSQGDGTLTVVRENGTGGYAVAQTVPTAAGARTMALDADRHRIYLVTADFDQAAAAPDGVKPRRTIRPDSFRLLAVDASE